MYIFGELVVANNTATDSGGGIHLYQSELNCEDTSILQLLGNSASIKGGGIHATSSLVKMNFVSLELLRTGNFLKLNIYYSGSLVYFSANKASLGGGICLEANAKVYILKLFSDRTISKSIYHPLFFRPTEHTMEELCMWLMRLTLVPVLAYLMESIPQLPNVHFKC